MCRRLYIAANISLWLCNSNFQPKHCEDDNGTRNATVFVDSLNITELLNITTNTTTVTTTLPRAPSPWLPSQSPPPTPSPSPLVQSPSPRPSSITLRASVHTNHTNHTTQRNTTSSNQPDFTGLHALWSLVPIVLVVVVILRKKGVQVGYWKKPIRSQSWPTTGTTKANSHDRSQSTPSTKIEFDSIHTIEL